MGLTEEVRGMLDGRGVEYQTREPADGFRETRWDTRGLQWTYTELHGSIGYLSLPLQAIRCTPSEAVSMTLGEQDSERLVQEAIGYLREMASMDDGEARRRYAKLAERRLSGGA